jgi:exosortase
MGVVLVAAVAWLYAETLAGLGKEWISSPDTSYGLVLVAVAGAVAWQRRAQCARALADRGSPGRAGTLALAAGLLLYLVGQFGADIFLTRLSFIVVIAGATWLVAGGRVVRVMTAPLAFLLMAVPLPALVVNAVTLPLQFTASRIADGALTAAGVPVFRDGNVLELPSTTLEVAEACSGLRSLVSLTAIAILLAWSASPSRDGSGARVRSTSRGGADQPALARWPMMVRGAAIVAAALPVAIVMNGLRIAAIGLACERWGPQMASGAWHTFSGWVTFLVSAVVLIAIQRVIAPDLPAAPAVEGAAAA